MFASQLLSLCNQNIQLHNVCSCPWLFRWESIVWIFFVPRTFDLSLPTIHHYLPHTVHSPNSFIPAFKLSKNKSQVRIVLGIPTVKRDHQVCWLSFNYLMIEMDKTWVTQCIYQNGENSCYGYSDLIFLFNMSLNGFFRLVLFVCFQYKV